MKRIVFTEEFCQPQNLFPFTLTRPIQDIRVGILSIREKWEAFLGLRSADKTGERELSTSPGISLEDAVAAGTVFLIHGNVLPTPRLVRQVKKLKAGECLSLPGKESIVYCLSKKEFLGENAFRVNKAIDIDEDIQELMFPWDIVRLNSWAIGQDYELLTWGRKSVKRPSHALITGEKYFIEKGARIEHCILNSTDGPIYIGKNAVIMDGSILRGPASIGEGAVVKMGTKIYGGTTVGPHCVVGGELKNSILIGNSNKAHDGYLGDSVIGEWCNLGAGTTNSNLKNNVSDVVVWTASGPRSAGTKCGVMMGDHSRTAINTSINTGTVIGVSCNVFGSGLTPKYIPNFSWGADGVERYRFEKALLDLASWKALKGGSLDEAEEHLLKHIFDHY